MSRKRIELEPSGVTDYESYYKIRRKQGEIEGRQRSAGRLGRVAGLVADLTSAAFVMHDGREDAVAFKHIVVDRILTTFGK